MKPTDGESFRSGMKFATYLFYSALLTETKGFDTVQILTGKELKKIAEDLAIEGAIFTKGVMEMIEGGEL